MRATHFVYDKLKKEPWFAVMGMDQQYNFCKKFLRKVDVMRNLRRTTMVICLARAYARAEGFVVD